MDLEFTGKTVEDAIKSGLKEMELTEETADITVIEEGGKGIFAKKAKVKIAKKQSDGERALSFLEGMLDKMKVAATCELTSEEEKIVINVTASSSSAIIGYRGEVLDALQTLTGAIANIGREDYRRLVVDCEGYRSKREETLKNLAMRLAEKAVKTGRKMKLEPMNPYERRIIHACLSENTEIKTVSEGKEPNRYITIIPNNLKPFDQDEERRGGFGRRDFSGRGRDNRDGGRNRNGFRRERTSNFTEDKKAPKTFGYGTFLGNSNKKEED